MKLALLLLALIALPAYACSPKIPHDCEMPRVQS